MKLSFKLLALGVVASVTGFGSVVFVSTPGGLGSNDSTTWGQLGADTSTITNTFSATSTGAIGISGAFNSSTGTVADIPSSWPAGTGFNSGDALIWANNGTAGSGPITLTFSSLIVGGGFYVQGDTTPGGTFTVQIQALDASNGVLGSFTQASDGVGDPLFVGVLSSATNIDKIKVSLTVCATCNGTGDLNDFAIDTLFMQDAAAVGGVPEPTSGLLIGSGLAGMLWVVRRRRAGKSNS